MINTIRADFYRLFHSVGFYITQAMLIVIVVALIIGQAVGTVGLKTSSESAAQLAAKNLSWTGSQTIQTFSSMAAFLIYFCLSLFVITVGYDLTRGMLKNLLTSGISRTQFFFSKWAVFLVVSAVQFIFYYGLSFITASLLHGVGNPSSSFLSAFFGSLTLQYLCLQALFALGLLVLILLFSNVGAVLTVIIFPIVVGICTLIFSKLTWITYFDFQGGIGSAWVLSTTTATRVALAAIFFIIACVSVSYLLFQKKNL